MEERKKDYRRLVNLSFEALSTGGIFAILFVLVDFIWQVYDFIRSIYNFIKPFTDSITAFVYKWIIPAINWLNVWITTFKNIILVIQGNLDQVIEDLYKKVFPGIEDLRKAIESTYNKVIDIVSVFSREAADKLAANRDELLRAIDKYTRDIRDELIYKIHEYTDPVISKLNEILIIIDTQKRDLLTRLKPVEDLIAITFEKPNVIKRETFQGTSQRWGVDLWNDLFSGITPTTPVTPSLERVQLKEDAVIDKYIEIIFAGKDGDWKDVSARIDEEIRELYYGEVILVKTKITVPKLPKPKDIPRSQVPTAWTGIKFLPL